MQKVGTLPVRVRLLYNIRLSHLIVITSHAGKGFTEMLQAVVTKSEDRLQQHGITRQTLGQILHIC